MFDRTAITSALVGVVGIKQPTNSDDAIVSTTNQVSSSGRYVTDNPFIKVPILKAIQDDENISISDFNTWLTNKQKSAITNVCDSIFDQSDYIDRQMLYQFANNKQNIESPSGFVGYEISQCIEKNIAFEIPRIIIEFKESANIILMLFNTAKKSPLFTKSITVTEYFHEEELGWVVRNASEYKGKYYIGYVSNGEQPYKRDYEYSNVKSTITYLQFNSITVDTSESTLFDLNNIESSDDCHGLNPDVIIYKDYTDLIIRNKNLLGKAIQLQWQIDMISEVIPSIRSNRLQRITSENVMDYIAEIDGVDSENLPNKVGLRSMLSGEIRRLSLEIERLKNGYFSNGFELKTLQ